jgi:hypothetical protein
MSRPIERKTPRWFTWTVSGVVLCAAILWMLEWSDAGKGREGNGLRNPAGAAGPVSKGPDGESARNSRMQTQPDVASPADVQVDGSSRKAAEPKKLPLRAESYKAIPPDNRRSIPPEAHNLIQPPGDEQARLAWVEGLLSNYKASTAVAEVVSEGGSQDGLAGAGGALQEDTVLLSQTNMAAVPPASTRSVAAAINNYDPDYPNLELLRKALSPDQPQNIRLQALYLLEDLAPNEAARYLQDKDEAVRLEAARILKIYPPQ